MAHVADHLSVSALEQQYRSCTDVTAARHVQTIWLLAKGHEIAAVSATGSFARRWVEIPWARLVAPALWQSKGAEPPTLERPCKPSVLDLTNTLLSAPISTRSSCPWSSAVQPGSSPPWLGAAARRCRSIRCPAVTSPLFWRVCPNSTGESLRPDGARLSH